MKNLLTLTLVLLSLCLFSCQDDYSEMESEIIEQVGADSEVALEELEFAFEEIEVASGD